MERFGGSKWNCLKQFLLFECLQIEVVDFRLSKGNFDWNWAHQIELKELSKIAKDWGIPWAPFFLWNDPQLIDYSQEYKYS